MTDTMIQSSPLIAVGMQYVHDGYPNLSSSDQQALESALSMFLSNRLTFKETSPIFMRTIGSKKPLNRILAILQTPEQPIPDSVGKRFQYVNKSRHWTSYEDRRLLAAIHRYGCNNWMAVATFVGNNRSKGQCCQRWARGLNPEIKKDKWLPEEEELLLKLVNSGEYKSWASIAAKMKIRSDVQCRYHYKLMTGSETLKYETIAQFPNSKIEICSPPSIILEEKQRIILPSIHTFFDESNQMKIALCSARIPQISQLNSIESFAS
ncbi:hypothetical protein M9Y10_009267 [Tritrichomonas musculus]|uniref:Myb-like DNA-binding domain containing protein n=1 Tax=Tritrichomonas musculus TaxID=1915356 RepID=A0ABR2IP22_9EUKA